MKRVICRLLLLGMVSLLTVLVAFPGNASAYFNWGTVGVSLGSGSVTVAQGSSAKVSVSLSPASMDQLPGCGMAECPQTCGEKDCLDANGQCTCAGTTYQTYHTSVSVKSSNSGVATASYSGGALTISGKSAGSATITVTADLRQWSPGSKSINVTVTAPTTPTTAKPVTTTTKKPTTTVKKPTTTTKKSTATTLKPGATTTKKITTTTKSPTTTTAGVSVSTVTSIGTTTSSEPRETTSMTTPEGRTSVQIPLDGTMARAADFQSVAGQDADLTFWSGDSVGNVSYSWTFPAKELPADLADLDLGISSSASAGGSLGEVTQGKDCLFLNFNHSGPLPAPATIYLRLDGAYADGTSLNLYHYDPETGEILKLASGRTVVNGYVDFTIEECSILILSPAEIASSALDSGAGGGEAPGAGMGGGMIALVIGVPIVVVLIAAFLVWRYVWMPRRQHNIQQ